MSGCPKSSLTAGHPKGSPEGMGRATPSSLLGGPTTSLDQPDPGLLRLSHLSSYCPCLEATVSPAPGPRMLQGFPKG